MLNRGLEVLVVNSGYFKLFFDIKQQLSTTYGTLKKQDSENIWKVKFCDYTCTLYMMVLLKIRLMVSQP